MDLLQNPFYILTASPCDSRRRILELADERSLLLDPSEIEEARAILSTPRKRLSAEIAWLPGMGERTEKLLSLLSDSPADLLAVDKLSSIARSNLLVAGLARLSEYTTDEVVRWILEIARAFEDIDAKELRVIINEERNISDFPEVSDLSDIEAEIQEQQRYYCKVVIKSALDNLSSEDLVKAVTVTVESATNNGKKHGPILIADLAEMYELEAREFLDKEEENIRILIEKLQTALKKNQPDSVLTPMVKQLIQVVKNWDTVAQPIQVNAKSLGSLHSASHRVAHSVRWAIHHIWSEHGNLDFSQKLTTMLQEVFAEVGEISELIAQDADHLHNIAERNNGAKK
jgi:hypothetical protein